MAIDRLSSHNTIVNAVLLPQLRLVLLMMIARAFGRLSQAQSLAWRFRFYGSAWLPAFIIKKSPPGHKLVIILRHHSLCNACVVSVYGTYFDDDRTCCCSTFSSSGPHLEAVLAALRQRLVACIRHQILSHEPDFILQHQSSCVDCFAVVFGLYLVMIARAFVALSQAQSLAWRQCLQFCGSAWLPALIIKEGLPQP